MAENNRKSPIGNGGIPWAKGKSGNPGGRPKVIGEVRDLARVHTTAAINALASICKDGESEAARVAAAVALLDRGYGKSVQSMHVTPHNPAEVSDDELAHIATGGSHRAFASSEGSEVSH